MSSDYPYAYDSFSDPAGSDPLTYHSELHTAVNDALEAIQSTLGINPQGSDATVADRLGDEVDVTDLPTGLDAIESGDSILVLQDDALVVRDADDVLDRSNHTGDMPYASTTAVPYLQYRAGASQAIPNNDWTAVGFTTNDGETVLSAFPSASTTVASGSNGVALPIGGTPTLNVASTTGFPSSGHLLITGPPSSGVTTLVAYSGKTSTTFTGCAFGSGTLATGQTVTSAAHSITLAPAGLYLVSWSLEFAANSTGNRGGRLVISSLLPSGEIRVPAAVSSQVTNLTGSTLVKSDGTTTVALNCYQNSGGSLNSVSDVINAPRITIAYVGAV